MATGSFRFPMGRNVTTGIGLSPTAASSVNMLTVEMVIATTGPRNVMERTLAIRHATHISQGLMVVSDVLRTVSLTLQTASISHEEDPGHSSGILLVSFALVLNRMTVMQIKDQQQHCKQETQKGSVDKLD